jgi:hypothetical protein
MSFQNPLPAGIRQVVPDYVSDGATLIYNFPFRLWATADLAVLTQAVGAAVWTQLNLSTDYTVALLSNGLSGANITLAVAQPAGTLIRLEGLRTPSRLTSVVNNGSVQSAPLESELDCVEATMQELRRDMNAFTAAVAEVNLQQAILTALGAQDQNFATLRQAQTWLAATSTNGLANIYVVDNAIPADIANAVTIQWRRGNVMRSGDALYAFIQSVLSLSSAQMSAALAAMKGYTP